MNFMFSWQEQYLTRSLRSLVGYCLCRLNIKFISFRHRVISSMKAITRELSISWHNPDLHVSLFSRNEMHYLQYAYWTRSRYDSSLLRNHFDRVNMDLLFNFKIFPLPKETRQKLISHFSIWSLACDFSVVWKMDNKPLSFYESEKYTVSKHEYNQCLK